MSQLLYFSKKILPHNKLLQQGAILVLFTSVFHHLLLDIGNTASV